MRNSVAFIAAPYGFGPSSKAVAISSYLPRSIERVFVSEGPPLEMARGSNEFSTCIHLDFSAEIESVEKQLSSYDVLVFINSTRFILPSITTGRPTILVETLAWLRDARPPCAPLLSAYFAQGFFHWPFASELESMENFYAIGVIVPRTVSAAFGANGASSPTKSPLVHCGGLFSPAMIDGAAEEFAAQAFAAITTLKEPVRAILPAHLHERFRTRVADSISLLDCSPLSVHEHIMGSEFSITTTGIEFTYESMLLGAPTLFLPPFNASQYFQLAFHRNACSDSVPFGADAGRRPVEFSSLHQATAEIQKVGMAGIWGVQFEEVSRFLQRLLPKERTPILRRIRERQQKAIEGIGVDGAQRVASHALREVGLEFVLQ